MPQIAGFRGVLYDSTRVELAKVVAPPADSISDPATRAALVAQDPHNVMRLTQADSPPGTFASWLASGVLQRDSGRAVYRYHQVFTLGDRRVTRKTLIAAVRLTPWAEGIVRPHEVATPAARDAALHQLTATATQLEPVLAGYLDAAGEIDRLFRNVENDRPTLEVTTPGDGTLHRLWRMRDAETLGKLRHQFAPKKLHVLDGHARYEAMVAYREQLDGQGLPLAGSDGEGRRGSSDGKRPLLTYSAGNYGLACLVDLDDPVLQLVARHRVIRGAITREAVLAAARAWFIVEPLAGAARDAARLQAALADTLAHQPAFVAVFAGEADAWKLTLKPDVSPTSEGVQIHRALAKVDPVIVESLFIGRALAGTSPVVTADPDAAAVLAQVHGGGAQLALILRAVTMEQLKQTSELAQTLPAGSTAFVPRIASGLVMNVIDPDEDLV